MLLLLLAFACGQLSLTRSCDLRTAESDNDKCQEYQVYGPDMLALQGTCEAIGGTWGGGECPRDGILGGCENQDPSNPWQVTEWYYGDIDTDLASAEDVEAKCDPDEHEVYVEAP